MAGGSQLSIGRHANVALAVSVRGQASAPDKRFHCSICKKAFRLEMAAKLHVQQVHSGEGTVETGAGPGQADEQTTPTPVGVFRNAPPQAPTVVSPIQPDLHERATRREKPAPKPLHQAEREVPSLLMDKMLAVWDDIGVQRIGSQFVHSSMVMRVFAARPADSAEPLYGEMSPEGENPFTDSSLAASAANDAAEAEESNIYSLCMTDAFAMASEEAFGPFRPARCPNPFLRQAAPEMRKASAKAESAEQQTAPVTPFGQLPMFGHIQSPPPTPEVPVTEAATPSAPATLVTSPFASSTANSPFAGTTTSPFAEAAYSPFAAEEEAAASAAAPAPAAVAGEAAISSAVPSPFLPHAAGVLPPSPFAAAASPFAASPFATSADGLAAAAAYTIGPDRAFGDGAALAAVAETVAAKEAPRYMCAVCEKSFSSHEGLRMHSRAKHGLELQKEPSKQRQSVPDLPAYIPSPVDLTMTSPFGSSAQTTAWTEVELTPYAQSISNITIAGRVVDVDVLPDESALLVVFVRGRTQDLDEVITIHCSAEAMRTIESTVGRGESVFACGSLRLLPVKDESNQKVYASPVVYVTSPTGMIAKLSATS